MLHPAAWERPSCCCSLVAGAAAGNAPEAPGAPTQAQPHPDPWLAEQDGLCCWEHVCVCTRGSVQWLGSVPLSLGAAPGSQLLPYGIGASGAAAPLQAGADVAQSCLHNTALMTLFLWRNSCVVARYCGFGLPERESVLLAVQLLCVCS